ncbi:MAG: hypothetical protein C3F15_10600 [Holophagae bacterium]|nr:MAG: hypothetical protein C3F15_10600 [Holophagae bacterium]
MKKRGAATKGRAAKVVAGADFVEVKATIPPQQVVATLKRYGLDPATQVDRYTYFFDTPDLDLLDAGVIARARRVVGGTHDSTVKFRPVVPDEVPRRWQKYTGFKIEADASDRGVVTSASLTMPVEKGLIKKVAAGEDKIGVLFAEEQINFLLSMAHRTLDYSKLIVLGPIEAFRWKLADPALPWPMTVELWRRPDGQQIMEISVKAPAVQAAVIYFGFMAFLAEVGAERDPNQQAKTRWALDFFAAKAKQKAAAGTRRKAGGPAARVRRSGRPAGRGATRGR